MSLSKPAKLFEDRQQPSPRKERKNQKDLDKALKKVLLHDRGQNKCSEDPVEELEESKPDDQDPKKELEAVRKQLAETRKMLALLKEQGSDAKNSGSLEMASPSLKEGDGEGAVSTDGTAVTYSPPAAVATPFTASFNYTARDTKGAESVAPATVSIAWSTPPKKGMRSRPMAAM